MLLLHGPVGSAKSTIVSLLKKGLEDYTKTDEGAVYSYDWRVTDDEGKEHWESCPMHEDPVHLIPLEFRKQVLAEMDLTFEDNSTILQGDLCPFCRHYYWLYLNQYNGNWGKVVQEVRVRRLVFSEKDRICIGTFQPKDEKNQDSTELTGDINYRKIALYGSDFRSQSF